MLVLQGMVAWHGRSGRCDSTLERLLEIFIRLPQQLDPTRNLDKYRAGQQPTPESAKLSCARRQLVALVLRWHPLAPIPLKQDDGQSVRCMTRPFLRSDLAAVPTCSWTQPSTQRHLSVTEYRAYDMLVLASKHQAVFCSVPIFLPLQNRGQMAWGPLW